MYSLIFNSLGIHLLYLYKWSENEENSVGAAHKDQKMSHHYDQSLMNHFKIESSIVISREIVKIGQNWAYKNGLKLIRVFRLKMKKGLNWNNMAARTGAFSSVPVRLTHLDGLSLNMFLTHFCFRQLSPLKRDLNNTCYPFLTNTGGSDRYSGLSGVKFGPARRGGLRVKISVFFQIF